MLLAHRDSRGCRRGRHQVEGRRSASRRRGIARIPDYLSYEESSCLPCAALTAWKALHGLVPPPPQRPGQTVVLQGHGWGGRCLACRSLPPRARGTIVTSSSSDAKLDAARAMGASHGTSYAKTPDRAAEAKRLTGGVGADHIIECRRQADVARAVRCYRLQWIDPCHQGEHLLGLSNTVQDKSGLVGNHQFGDPGH